jgi:hypothetical protein
LQFGGRAKRPVDCNRNKRVGGSTSPVAAADRSTDAHRNRRSTGAGERYMINIPPVEEVNLLLLLFRSHHHQQHRGRHFECLTLAELFLSLSVTRSEPPLRSGRRPYEIRNTRSDTQKWTESTVGPSVAEQWPPRSMQSVSRSQRQPAGSSSEDHNTDHCYQQ